MDGIFIKIQNILKIIVLVIKLINFKTKNENQLLRRSSK